VLAASPLRAPPSVVLGRSAPCARPGGPTPFVRAPRMRGSAREQAPRGSNLGPVSGPELAEECARTGAEEIRRLQATSRHPGESRGCCASGTGSSARQRIRPHCVMRASAGATSGVDVTV
jgi:hypothetical protein